MSVWRTARLMRKVDLSGRVLLVALAALPLAACGAGSHSSAGNPNMLTVALADLGTQKFDPRNDIGGSQYAWSEIYDQLIGVNPAGQPDHSGLAKSWKIDPDGRSVTFALKKGVKWDDGSEFTSADVVYTLAYYRRPGTISPAGGYATSTIKAITANGPWSATIHFNESATLGLDELNPVESFFYIVPKAYIEKNGPNILSTKPDGTGPYKLLDQQFGQYIDLVANKSYRDPSEIPAFNEVRLELVPEGTTREALIQSGQVDIAQIDSTSVPSLENARNVELKSTADGSSTIGVFLKSYDSSNLSNNINFRKAMNLAINRQAILKAKYPPGYAKLLAGSGLYATGTNGADPNLKPYPYDPAEAKKLLQGIYHGQQLTMYSYSTGGYDTEEPSINTLLQGYWANVGLNVKLIPIDYSTFRPRVETQNYPANSLGTFAPAPRPSMVSQLRIYLNSINDGGSIYIYQNPAQAEKWSQELSGITSSKALSDKLLAINKEIYNQYSMIPLFEQDIPYAVNTAAVSASWVPGNLRRVSMDLHLAKPAS